MEKKSFFKTKQGGLTIAFIVIILAFILILWGLRMRQDAACMAGFILMVAAMLYAPVKVFVIDCNKKKS